MAPTVDKSGITPTKLYGCAEYTSYTATATYSATITASRPVGGYVLATDGERDAFIADFEADVGKLTKKQRKALKARIAGWAAR